MNRAIDLVFDVLVDILAEHLAATPGLARGALFPSAGGTPLSPDNVRRMLEETADAANELCEQRGLAPIMDCTPHMLRRTNISLLAAAGYDPAWIMDQVGHTDPKRIYTQVRRRSEGYRARERAARPAPQRVNRPTSRPSGVEAPDLMPGPGDVRHKKNPAAAGLSRESG